MILPTELWLHILWYLPERDFECLIGVNRQLRDVVLALRYRKAIAAPGWMRRWDDSKETANNYIYFHNNAPPVLQLVRELVFKDDPSVNPPGRIGVHFFPLQRRAFKRLFTTEHHRIRRYFTQLLHRVDSLSSVQAITFQLNTTSDDRYSSDLQLEHPYLKYKMKIFYALKDTRVSSITSLSLQTDLHVLLPHWKSDIVFPNLAKLSVKVHINNLTDLSPITQLFHPLVNNHRKSLTELILTHSFLVDLKNVLNGLGHLPKLQAFSLGWLAHNTGAQQQAMSGFMKKHAAQLVDLRLRIYSNNMRIACLVSPGDRPPADDTKTVLNGCFDINFRALQHFSLVIEYPPDRDVVTLHDFLRRHDTLVSLTLLPADIRPQDQFPVDLMAHFRSENGSLLSFALLRDLRIYSLSLDTPLMVFLASSFPSLQYVCIYGLIRLLSEPENILQSTHLVQLFASWKLPDMYFQYIASVFPEFAKRELVGVLTGVDRFCGRSPQSWVLGDSRLDRFMISSSSPPEGLAPGYYTWSSY